MSELAASRVDTLLDSIAEKSPAPGGGAVTGLVGAIAVALARMVVSYSVDAKKCAEHRPALIEAAESLDAHRARLVRLADADAEAYGRYNQMDKDDPDRTEAAIACVEVPLSVIDACAELMALYARLAPISNRYLHSDLAIAAILTEAVARASMCNVSINLPLLEGTEQETTAPKRGEAGVRAAAEKLPEVLEACA